MDSCEKYGKLLSTRCDTFSCACKRGPGCLLRPVVLGLSAWTSSFLHPTRPIRAAYKVVSEEGGLEHARTSMACRDTLEWNLRQVSKEALPRPQAAWMGKQCAPLYGPLPKQILIAS